MSAGNIYSPSSPRDTIIAHIYTESSRTLHLQFDAVRTRGSKVGAISHGVHCRMLFLCLLSDYDVAKVIVFNTLNKTHVCNAL